MKVNTLLVAVSFLSTSLNIQSQEVDLNSLQENVDIFAGIVEESLELDQTTGLFGMSLGGVDSLYLYGQGAVLEIRTPLANRRNQMTFDSVNRGIQALNRANPFARARAQTSSSDLNTGTENSAEIDESASLYQDMMDRIANVDYSLIVDSAIQQASESARSLRNSGTVDDNDYAELQQELNNLRAQTAEKMAEMRELMMSAMNNDADAEETTAESSIDLQAKFDDFLAKVEPLKEEALAKAAELKARSEQVQREYVAQIETDIENFETKLFVTLCSYGATLRELPASENLSIVLDGLGENTERSNRTDKIYVMTKSDLLKCQAGDIDAPTLLAQSVTYSY